MRGSFPENVPYGECNCGCGEKTNLSSCTWKAKGWVKGEPMKFILGHHVGNKFGKNAPGWKGGRTITNFKHRDSNYVLLFMPEHPRSHKNGYVFEHILVAEKALGKPLPQDAEVHHIDGNGLNNNNNNLVVCQDHAYHMTLHKRGENGKWLKMN